MFCVRNTKDPEGQQGRKDIATCNLIVHFVRL